MPGGRWNEPLDVGTITARLFDMIKIGDVAPDFDVERIAINEKGRRLKLSDYRGKLVLLEFWDSWNRSNEMTVLKEVQATFGGDSRFALISLACWPERRSGTREVHQGEWAELDARRRRRLRLRYRIALQDQGDPQHFLHRSRSDGTAGPVDVPDWPRRARPRARPGRRRSGGRAQGAGESQALPRGGRDDTISSLAVTGARRGRPPGKRERRSLPGS